MACYRSWLGVAVGGGEVVVETDRPRGMDLSCSQLRNHVSPAHSSAD